MYRERCRPKYSIDELAAIYQYPWSLQGDWKDHDARLLVTEKVANAIITSDDITAADLSCGDAYWKQKFSRLEWELGDYAPGYDLVGPIEVTVAGIDPVDVFFLCETLEHLDDPDLVLRMIRNKAKKLVLSTPNSYQWDENPEHYWAWDKEAVREMLITAGWIPSYYKEANGWGDWDRVNGYCFQIWGCT